MLTFLALLMATGYKVIISGTPTDLDSLFAPRAGSTARADTGFMIGSQDASDRYYASTGGDTISAATGFKSGGSDFQALFRDISYVATYTPSITVNPSNHTGNEGDAISLSVTATGSATLTYQWRKGGSNISGATASTYSISSPVYTDSGSFDCVVTNSYGSATSSAATVTVHRNVYITSQPVDDSDYYGTSAALTVTVAGDGSFSYEWFKNGVGLPDYPTPNILSVSSRVWADEDIYQCVITSSYGAVVYSDNARIYVLSHLAITTQPTSLNVDDGVGPYALTVVATGDGTLTYQWYKSGLAISGATGYQHVINPVTSSANFGTYACVVTDGGGNNLESDTVHVWPYPVITAQPYDATGASFSWSNGVGPYGIKITASSSAGVHYQWYHDGTTIGSDANEHDVNPAVMADAGDYWCIVTDGNGLSVESSHITVTVS